MIENISAKYQRFFKYGISQNASFIDSLEALIGIILSNITKQIHNSNNNATMVKDDANYEQKEVGNYLHDMDQLNLVLL